MSYLPKTIVEKGIKKRVRKDRNGKEHTDYEAYFGTDPFSKNAVRITRANEEELKKAIKDFYLRHQSGGDAAVRLTATQALDAKTAIDALTEAKVCISLTDAVKAFLSGSARVTDKGSDISIGKAYKEFFDGKDTSETDRNIVQSTVGKWVIVFGADRKLNTITAKDVLDYLQANYIKRVKVNKKTGKKVIKEYAPKTYNNHLLYLKQFFNWCTKDERQYLPKNPIKSLQDRHDPWVEPEYMKPDDVERLFRLLESVKSEHPEYLAQAIVGFFTGTRAIEIRRMADVDSANKINIEDETVRIAKGKGFQHGRRPRSFHISPTAMAWMKSFDFMSAVKKIDGSTIGSIYKLARKNGIPVFQNCGRHTFITMDVAAYGKPEETQAKVGTSGTMRAENYCGLASKAFGEAYFRILPSNDLSRLEY